MSEIIHISPDGKKWRVIAVRIIKPEDLFIGNRGEVIQSTQTGEAYFSVRTIVEPMPTPRRVPTDQDAAVWPRRKCWVRDDEDEEWIEKPELLYVQSDASFPFITSDGCWRYCEIEDDTQLQNGV